MINIKNSAYHALFLTDVKETAVFRQLYTQKFESNRKSS
jgi:hypothetical protein